MLPYVHYYVADHPPQGLFDTLFGGLFLVKGVPLVAQLGVILLFGLGLYWAAKSAQNRLCALGSLCAAIGLFIGLWFFTINPWDELFINLQHSALLSREGRFSFSSAHWVEGTVDWLPYAVLGLAARCGLPIVEGAFVMSGLGALACVWIAHRWLKHFPPLSSTPATSVWITLGLVLYPPLAFNAGHGFATTVFTAWVGATIYALWIHPRPRLGILLAATLPLIRPEGLWLTLLVILFDGIDHRFKNLGWKHCALMLLPAALHLGVRYSWYGEPIPLPIVYKAGTNTFYFALGLRNLLADLIGTHTLAVWAVLLGFGVDSLSRRIGALLVLFTLPYYLSGGDWFPSYWARYLLPLAFFSYALMLRTIAHNWGRSDRKLQPMVIGLIIFLFSSLWPLASAPQLVNQVFQQRRTLARIHPPTIARGHYRIQHLSQLGSHLKATTLATDRIGSSELATIMFHAQRDAVDFLGLTDAATAKAPLRQSPQLLRQFPYRSELPYLIFKRLRPGALAETRPEFLYTFDFLLRDQLPGIRLHELDLDTLARALRRWEVQMDGLLGPLYGGLEQILELGYEPVVVQAGDDFLSLYFVSGPTVERHTQALLKRGFLGGRKSLPVRGYF